MTGVQTCALPIFFLSNPRLAPDLEDGSIENNPFLNGAAIAINVEAFGSRDMFEAEAARLGQQIAKLPRAEGVDKIMLPGERGDAVRAEREAKGIPVAKGTWDRILKTADKLGVKAPV